MLHALVAQAAQQTEEVHGKLPMPPIAFMIVALCILAMMLIVTLSFKSIGTRH